MKKTRSIETEKKKRKIEQLFNSQLSRTERTHSTALSSTSFFSTNFLRIQDLLTISTLVTLCNHFFHFSPPPDIQDPLMGLTSIQDRIEWLHPMHCIRCAPNVVGKQISLLSVCESSNGKWIQKYWAHKSGKLQIKFWATLPRWPRYETTIQDL